MLKLRKNESKQYFMQTMSQVSKKSVEGESNPRWEGPSVVLRNRLKSQKNKWAVVCRKDVGQKQENRQKKGHSPLSPPFLLNNAVNCR